LKEAEALFLHVLEKRKRVLGPEHPDTLASMSNLATTWRSLGSNVRASVMMRECSELRRNLLGSNHPATVESLER
jgi:hypothetical protein